MSSTIPRKPSPRMAGSPETTSTSIFIRSPCMFLGVKSIVIENIRALIKAPLHSRVHPLAATSAAHPPGREAPRSSSSDDDASDVAVSALLTILLRQVSHHSGHEAAECFRAVLSVLGELLRALLGGRRFRRDNRDLGR